MNSLNIVDLEIKGLNEAKKYFSHNIKYEIFFLRCVNVILGSILINFIITNKTLSSILYMIFVCVFWFVIIEIMVHDIKDISKSCMEEIKLFISGTYSTISYDKESKDSNINKKYLIYWNNNIKSNIFTNVKSKNINKSILDFYKGYLYVNEKV